jgi:hypothetical protein
MARGRHTFSVEHQDSTWVHASRKQAQIAAGTLNYSLLWTHTACLVCCCCCCWHQHGPSSCMAVLASAAAASDGRICCLRHSEPWEHSLMPAFVRSRPIRRSSGPVGAMEDSRKLSYSAVRDLKQLVDCQQAFVFDLKPNEWCDKCSDNRWVNTAPISTITLSQELRKLHASTVAGCARTKRDTCGRHCALSLVLGALGVLLNA